MRIVAIFALLGALAGGAAGQEPSEAELDRLTAEVADRLRCPVCRNQSILESPSELAREMQSVIRERLAAGESPEEVKAYFVSRYGEWVLLKPEPKGATLLVYVLPALAFLIGGGLVAWRLQRWAADRGARSTSDGSAPATSVPATASAPPTGSPPASDAPADIQTPAAAETPPDAGTVGDFSPEEEAWLQDALEREP